MSRDTADNLIEAGVLKEGSKVFTVQDAGHQLYFDNPTKTAELIVEYGFGAEEAQKLRERIEQEQT